ncbi:lipoprotein-related protein [Photobacterium gaetbulicola]|uniref:Lipoprotein-like protein n=2 Tax=Photobacterium gaetbulicola TaxID=1295392 RepID=A0A0C5W8I7_9GAMM|nr:YbaY family lipoprotein [Photobacterium gaetbulicola]AJR07861.1 lipoprotein-like protein [Photobacterium gaetbulicola Gung47]KHT63436.1 lipoprotein-related protein [Photobacterium gaetbulicola]PSU03189.1 lipoprotein-related protein [Photobacterium gaetbulicola]
MKRVFALISVLAVALIVSACSSMIQQDADLEAVTGTLMYKERIALPDHARITVTLADVSKMDVAAEVLSSQAFLADGNQVPFDYQLNFSRQEIRPNHTYAVSARIEVDGKLWFITDTANHVLTDQAESTHKDLVLVKVN